MDTNFEQSGCKALEKPPTLVAEAEGVKISGRNPESVVDRMTTVGDDKTAKMPVLQPNVNIEGTRTKSGRIHKPAGKFSSDDYVVPALTKRRIPNNSRAHLYRTPTPTTPSTSTASEMDIIRKSLEEKFPNASSDAADETPFTFIIGVCFKNADKIQNFSVADIHCKVKEMCKNWTKGPYKLREDEIKFLQECIVKPEWSRISMKEWGILAEALKDRNFRMRKRFARGGRFSKGKKRKEGAKKCYVSLGIKIEASGDEEELDGSDPDFDESALLDEDSSSHSSRISTRSKDPVITKGRGNSKTPSLSNTNDESKDVDFDLSLSSVGIDDITGDDLKEEMFDDLDSALVNESRNIKVGSSNSMVAALHATLQKEGGERFDPSQYEPPAFEKDNGIFALEDMEGVENNFFESVDDASFGIAEAQAGLSDEAFAELEQRVEANKASNVDNQYQDAQPGTSTSYRRSMRDLEKSNKNILGVLNMEKMDLSAVEIEESSGNVKMVSNSELGSPGLTMITTKIALMCALKISEDFLPTSHENYLDRLEETEKYRPDDLDDIRKKFNMKPSAMSVRRKLAISRGKMSIKIMNGSESKSKPLPFLRSAYAKCRKFMEDETTVIEKLGNKKIMAAGRIIDIDYENYLKESDVEIPMDDRSSPMPGLPTPTATNCHAPSCRLGCICSSISEDMPPRKHCGRPKCFFECNCQQLLFNNSDDGDIRSRLRPRVSLLNWRAESTEKEKEPMTSYRQMERGTHFIRMRRATTQPERLRREFVLDGKVVERTSSKVAKERLRTKALLHSSHRRIMAKPESHRFVRIVPGKADAKKSKVNLELLKKKCTPLTIDVEHLEIDVTEVVKEAVVSPKKRAKTEPIKPQQTLKSKMSSKDIEEMKSIILEMTEDCQLMALEDRIGFFSWCKGVIRPKVVMYQVMQGDELRVPWLYLPIPPQGYSWICHYLTSSFETTDYVYIPEIKCCIPSHALRVNMNAAFVRKKPVVFDVKTDGSKPGIGRIYFFPNLPKVLVCGPFRTDQTTTNPRDINNADQIAGALQHMEKLRQDKQFGNDQSWKKFTSAPTIFPIKKRTDNETILSTAKSRELFAQIYPSIIAAASATPDPTFKQPASPAVSLNWSNAVKLVGIGSGIPDHENLTLADLISMNL